MKGFHEIIPGLGAFPVRPSRTDSGISDLKEFINEVIVHLDDKFSQREQLAEAIHKIHSGMSDNLTVEEGATP